MLADKIALQNIEQNNVAETALQVLAAMADGVVLATADFRIYTLSGVEVPRSVVDYGHAADLWMQWGRAFDITPNGAALLGKTFAEANQIFVTADEK